MNAPFPTSTDDFPDRVESLHIDLVLAYKDDVTDNVKTKARETFENNLRAAGLMLRHESGKGITKEDDLIFVQIHAPIEVLERQADNLGLKMSVQLPSKLKKRHSTMKKYIPAPNFMTPNVDATSPRCLKATFREEIKELFLTEGSEQTIFTTSERTDIVWNILRKTHFADNEEEFGIRRMLNQDYYLAAYPLHDGPISLPTNNTCTNDRKELFEEWAKPANWFKIQPLDTIRDYFGDEVALYFVWLGFYTKMLIPASLMGLACFIYGLATMDNKNFNTASYEICNETGVGKIYLCPRCLNGACGYEILHNSCLYSRLTHVFDNASTVVFAVFMSFWATMFLELWKRKQARLVLKWGLTEAQMDLEARPEFESSVQTTRPNKFTGLPEPYIPFWNRVVRMLATVSGVAFMIIVVIGAFIGIIVYKIAIAAAFYDSGDDFVRENTALLTSLTAAIINLIVIMVLNIVYKMIAKFLTDWECPKTQSEYEDSFTFKIFIFEFVNCYSSLFYIAFFKGKFFTHPGDDKIWTTFLGIGADTCDPAGCLSELFIQLIVIMVGKQFFNNFMEVAVPFIKKCLASDENEELLKNSPQWEQDYKLSAPTDHSMALFGEFMEMILQFGFATLFVAAFPLAPIFALINNVVEIRLDASKILCNLRRPVPKRLASLGAWFSILQALTYIAVVTNAFVIAWTSEFIPRLVYLVAKSETGSLEGFVQFTLSVFSINDYNAASTPPEGITECMYNGFRLPPTDSNKYEVTLDYWHVLAARLAFVVIFEHLVMGISGVIAYAIPDLPRDVREQEYLEEKMLQKETQKRRLNRTRSMSPSTEALIAKSATEITDLEDKQPV